MGSAFSSIKSFFDVTRPKGDKAAEIDVLVFLWYIMLLDVL